MTLKLPFFWLLAAVTAVFFAAPAIGKDIGLRESLFLTALYVILATNLNLVIGYTGYVNFGNIVFFGLGGYIGIYLLTVMGWPLILAALAAGFAVSGIALLFGLGILRLRGAFFALATIGVNEAVKAFVSNFEPWGGATGMYLALSAYAPFGGPKAAQWTIYYMMIGVMGLSLFLSYGIKKSKFGLGLFAIREDEDAAAVLGVKTPVFKAIAYSVSGFLPALAGTLFFFKNGVIQPEQAFDLHLSIEAIVMVMLGGQGTIIGPALGAYVYEQLRSYLLTAAAFASFQLVIAGVLLLVIILFVPGGLMGWLYRQFPKLRKILE